MSFPVTPEKQRQLSERMARLGLREEDLDERFILAGGKGGQKVNKTSSCVVLRHVPTDTEVRCVRTRSQAMNRFHARRDLCEKVEEQREGARSKREQAREKIRRRKRKRGKRQKEKMLDAKSQQGKKKQLRRKPDLD